VTELVPEALEVVEVVNEVDGPSEVTIIVPTSVDAVEIVPVEHDDLPAVEVLVPGERGPRGHPGEGAPGAYEHTQEVPSTVWNVQHDLGFDPAAVRVVAVSGDEWWPTSVTYVTPGQVLRLAFITSIAGTARVS
jgi:hypothetical protein